VVAVVDKANSSFVMLVVVVLVVIAVRLLVSQLVVVEL
jgi:hypothetical protein